MAGPAGYEQNAVVLTAFEPGFGRTLGSHPAAHFLLHKKWLGKIKQALTIYKEDIRQRLEDYDPESK